VLSEGRVAAIIHSGSYVEVVSNMNDHDEHLTQVDDAANGGDSASAESISATEQSPARQLETVDALKARIAELEDSLLRAKADNQNIRRRSAIEQADAIRYANVRLMQALLGVVDDLERTLTSLDQGADPKSIYAGIRLIHANLTKALTDCGMEPIEALRKPFDPQIHEALMQQPSAEHPAGTVINEVARGYRLGDRVIRPARVIVAKGAEAQSEPLVDGNHR